MYLDDVESCSLSIMCISSDEDDIQKVIDLIVHQTMKNMMKIKIIKSQIYQNSQVFDYFTEVLPQEIIDQIIKYVRYYQLICKK